MKALVTGITGFVGSYLAEHLLEEKYKVIGIKRRRSPIDNVSHIAGKISILECELRDYASVQSTLEKIKPDVVFHLAAQSFVPTSFEMPVDTYETNVIGTLNLITATKNLKIDPVIHVCSTADVYGVVKKSENPIDENVPARPVSPYSASKAATEIIALQNYYSWHSKIVITRAFNHTGPRRDPSFAESSFARQIAQIENGAKPEIVVGNLSATRTYADVRDIVRAYRMVTVKGKFGEIYNVAGDNTVRIGDVLKRLIKLSTRSDEIKVKKKSHLLRAADYAQKIPNDKKFRKLTGWKPQIEFSKTLEDLLYYWRDSSLITSG